MEIAPYINASFTPSAAPAGTTPADHLANGLYAYINADKDPELKKQSDSTFGRTVPFDSSETQATLIGRSFASHTGYRQNPLQYLRDNKLPVPPNWSGENYQLYTQIGQHIISKSQEHYNNAKAARDKALAEAQKDITELNNTLPSLIARSIRSAGGTPGTDLTPEELQKLTKYGMREDAIQAQHRAATAWSYMSAWMNNIDSMQATGRDKLLDIANTLSDEKGKLDPLAMAAFVLMVDEKATELQSTDSQFWADFADKFQNFWRTTNDQASKTGIGTAFAVSSLPELQPTWGQQYQAPEYYGDERVEKLYGYLNQAINTAISPSEKAEWHAKLLSEMGGLVGESIVPMAAGIAAGAALAPAGAFAAAAAGYAAGFAVSAPSAINNAIGNAYIKGVVNPELYGTLEGIGQAAAENIGGPATSLKLFTKTAGKLTNYAASRAAGSRFLANQYARTTLNYLTAGAFESVTELAEEEIGGYIGSRLNAMARYMGAEVSPQAYKLGEALKGMKDYEVAAIFGYSYALGFFGIPANYRAARTFAKNTDNLLKAGHTAKTARDIQLQAFKTEDRIAEIQADESLSPEQKKAAVKKEEQNFAEYQKNKFTSEALSNPNLRARLEKEGRVLREETEVALDVEHEADIQILKEHNILEAVVVPGQKYRVSFYEEGEKQADGTRAPGKVVTQEWTRMQLTNWLMLQKDTRIEQDLRSFNALLLAHAHAQSASVEETKAHFQNLGANRPLAALGELHKNGMTPGFFQKAAQAALQLQLQHQAAGMTEQEAAQQPSPDFEGLSLGEVQTLAKGAAERKEQEAVTTGALQNISDNSNVEYGGLNLLARDGTALIKYVAGKANILDMLEEKFEADIKQRTRGNKTLYNQLAETLLHIQAHLPGNIQLLDPKKKGNYTKSDFVEAYSKIATGAFLYNEKNLPINAAGHRLIQNIGRAVDNTRMFQLIGNAWINYANSPEGKEHLANGGQGIADIMQEAGFTFSRQLADARATAEQRAEVLEARNWQPAIEEELDALLEEAEEESELNKINEQEAKEPITIPADQSITGKEITVEPVENQITQGDAIIKLARAKSNAVESSNNAARSRQEAEKARKEYKKHLAAYNRLKKKHEGKTWKNKQEADYRASELEAALEYAESFKQDIERAESDAQFWNEKAKQYQDEAEKWQAIVDGKSPSEQETLVSSPDDSPAADLTGEKANTILSHMRDLIAKGKARAEHFAIVFREIPGLTEAQAIEQGIRPLTQRGEPTAAYTQGKLLAERCTDAEYLLLRTGKLTQKAKRNILGAPTQTRRNPAWPRRAKKEIAPADQRITIIKALQNAVDPAAENPNYNLNFTRHIISKGREYYIATDGRRLAVIERTAPKGSKDIEESLDKNGNVVKDAKFPESWRQVMITLTDKAQTLDLAPFRYLETYPKTAINHVVWQDSEGKLSKYNPNYIGKGIKFFSTLSKAIGSPSIIQVDNQNMGPILMQADHDGWTAKYLLMPMRLVDGDIYKEGDILLNPQTESPANFSIKAGTPSIELTSIATNRDEAEKILIARNVFNKPLLYKGEENYATALSKNGFRKLTDSHMTKKKLVPLGYTVAEAQTIHMTAVAHIDILFEKAYNAKPEAPYHGKGRESVPHLYSNFRIPGFVDEFTANISLLVFTDKNNGNKLYALRVEIQSPDKLRVPAEDNSANGRSIGAEDTIAQNAEDVNPKNQTTATESPDLFTDGVLEAQNAIVTQPDVNYSIKALHASPHKFRKFSTDFMGSGTGGQWYGWGLYFTRGQAAARIYFEGFKRRLSTTPIAYQVEINVNDDDLIDWAGTVDKSIIEKVIADNAEMPDYVKRNIRDALTGAEVYRYIQKWQERLVNDFDEAPKATSLLLLKSGIKGIRHQDNKSWAGDNPYGDNHYVIFSGDDIKITAVNETGTWSMEEGWEEYDNPTANFSIRAANPATLERFTADPLGERIVHLVRTEARRFARVLGDKTPQEQAVNAIASAQSIIMAVDKYLHRPDKPVSRRHRNQLTKLRSIIEKYAQIIASGTARSFKRISATEQAELEAAIAELEAAELDTAETDPALLIEDDKRMNKRTREARSREHHRNIVRQAAKGRVYATLASMLDATADALDDYLKDQLLTKLHRLTATVAIKRTPSKRLKGKMTAPMYRELEQAIQLMGYSARQKEDAVESILAAHETLAEAINKNEVNLTKGNALLIELAHQLEQEGTPVTAQTLTAALASHEARVAIFADIESKNYEQTRTAANALYHIIRYGRALWQQKHEAREENIQQYLQYFLANTTAEQGTEQANRTASEKEQKESGFTRFANSMMNSMQLFHALSGIDALAPLMEHTQRSLATANVARDLHMKQMVTHVQAVYGRILGIKPATEAGYSDKQLKEISKELDKFYAENNQREATGITRHYIDVDGKPQQEELELTKWQALDLILTYRQQHYRPNAEHHGYTDKVLDALEKWCGTNLMELGEAMQKSIINDGTIAVYEEREGIPLRENPLYWPGHLNIAEQDAPDHPVISNPYHGASSYKFLKGRTNNLREVSARNAYNVWKSAVAERANYVYLAPVTDTFNSLLARKEFAARLKTIIGPSLYNQLKETLREIDGTTWAETSLQEDPHGAVARALRNMAPALLAGNPTTLIRQASAVANATLMPDFPPHEFAKQLVQLQQNQSGITIGRILRLPVFQARARDNSALNEMLALGTDAKYSSYANLARKAMGVIDYVDTFCNAAGATLYYNYKYEQYTRENNENGNILTDAEIHAKCENDIAIMLALTAQPLKRTDKSAFFWRNSKTVLGPLYLYMGSELINKVGMARANWIKRKAEGMGSIKNTSLWLYSLGAGVGAVAFLTELAVAYLTGNTPDDDDSLSAWLIATYINSAYGQYTSQMPVIGQITDLFTSPYSALFSTASQIPGVKTIQSGKKIGKMLTDNKVYSVAEWQAEITRLARDLNGVAGYAGGVNSHMPWLTVTSSILQSLTTAMNAVYFISTGARNDAFYADWLLPDWYKETSSRRSKRKRTSKPRRSKSLVEQILTPEDK